MRLNRVHVIPVGVVCAVLWAPMGGDYHHRACVLLLGEVVWNGLPEKVRVL